MHIDTAVPGVLAACLTLACCGCRVASPPSVAPPNNRGPVARWTFDEPRGTEVRDHSGFGNHGTAIATRRVPGRYGDALSFETPESAVTIPCSPTLNLGSAISIEAWVRPGTPGETSRILVSKNDEYALRIDKPEEGGRLSFFVHVGQPAVAWEPRVSSPEPPTPDVWQHVAVTWDGTASRLYLDGELAATRERPGSPNPNPYPVIIGNWEYPSCHGTHFNGLIDDVRIYNRALKPEEIRQHATPPE